MYINGYETRERILDVAVSAFAERGYSGTGIAYILGEAEVPKGSFYHHFASKEALAVEAVHWYAAEFADWMRENIVKLAQYDAHDQVIKLLDAMKKRTLAEGIQRGCLVGTLAQELAGSDKIHPDLQAALDAAYEQWRCVIAQPLRNAKRSGVIQKTTSPKKLAAFFIDGYEGALIRAKLTKSTAPITNFISFAKSTFSD